MQVLKPLQYKTDADVHLVLVWVRLGLQCFLSFFKTLRSAQIRLFLVKSL